MTPSNDVLTSDGSSFVSYWTLELVKDHFLKTEVLTGSIFLRFFDGSGVVDRRELDVDDVGERLSAATLG